MCRRGFCQCEDGYYESNGKCKAELGEIVNSPEDCGDQAIWRNNKCGCKNSEFFDVGMQFCLKSAQGVETSCTQQSQCSPYGAYCPEERPKRCRCFDHTSYNEQTQFCEPKKGLGEYCVTSESCTVSNTDCSNVNTCVCKANYLEQNGLCKPGKKTLENCIMCCIICIVPQAFKQNATNKICVRPRIQNASLKA